MPPSNSETDQNQKSSGKPAFALKKGDEIPTSELLDNQVGVGHEFVKPKTESCMIYYKEETPGENQTILGISSSDGFHGLLEFYSEDNMTVLSRDNKPKTNILATVPSERATPDLDFKDIGLGLQNIGNAVKGTKSMGRPGIVYDTLMTQKWYFAIAIGFNGEVQDIIVEHDSGYIPTARGLRQGWGVISEEELPDLNISPEDYTEEMKLPESNKNTDP